MTTYLHNTPGTIHHAICKKLGLEKVKELLNNDPNLLNQKDPGNFNRTPLLYACCGGDSKDPIAFFLIEQGADVNVVQDAYGWNLQTALLIACYNKRRALVRRLLEAGADINYKNKDGETAFTIQPEFTPILQQIISEIATEKERIIIENLLGNRFLQIEAQFQATKQENEELKAENTKLRNDLQEENNRLKETIDDQNKLIKDLQEGNAKLKKDVEYVNEEITLLKQTNSDFQEENQKTIDDLNKLIKDLQEEIVKLKDENEAQVTDLFLEMETQLYNKDKQIEELKRQSDEKDTKIMNIEDRLTKHENELRQYIEARLKETF